jgi:hypothetical protein
VNAWIPANPSSQLETRVFKNLLQLLSLLLLVAFSGYAQKIPFSQDSAYSYLSVLVNQIGPRPMGSPAEQRALAYAVGKFREFGCQEAYVMPMTVAGSVNTSSGIAVGVIKGRSSRIIVIGGHIDSAGPEVPGANDDGSGAATVLELVRVLAKEDHASTIVACCWGGEEEGLRGSEHFVSTFPRMDDVALMLQVDMADGAGTLEADPDAAGEVSAPRWLVEAAFSEFYEDLHYEGLVYPSQSATLNSISGSTGSDHNSFLKKGIPAIDFTSDVNYPIHTPQDNWNNFTPSGLKRSGDLVWKLVKRFDDGVPSRGTEQYWLVILGHTPVFFSHTVLRVFAGASLILGCLVLILTRRRRSPDPAPVKWSALKLTLWTLVTLLMMWFSWEVVGLIRGLRYPWVNNVGAYDILALLAGLLGVWCALRSLRRFRLTGDAYRYFLRSFIAFVLFIALLSFVSAELGAYPALSLGILAMGMAVRQPLLKAACALLFPLPMLRLVFFEDLGLFQRTLTQSTSDPFSFVLVYSVSILVVLFVVALPCVFGFAALYRDAHADLFWLKRFRKAPGLVVVTAGIVVLWGILLERPVYDAKWQTPVKIQNVYTLGADSGLVTVTGGEFLGGLHASFDGRDTVFHGRKTHIMLQTARPATVSWLATSATESTDSHRGDSLLVFTRSLKLHSVLRPLLVNVSYRSDRPFTATSPWISGGRRNREKESDRLTMFSWYAFPDTNITVPVTFTVRDSQIVHESIEVVYDTLAYPVTLHKDEAYIQPRTVVNARASFGAPLKSGDEGI